MTEQNHALRTRHVRSAVLAALAAAALVLLGAAPALAASPAGGFTLTSIGQPSNFAPTPECNAGTTPPYGGCDRYVVTATNAGEAATNGSPITLTDTLPAGVSVQSIDLYWTASGANLSSLCTTSPVSCSFPLALQPGQTLVMVVHVAVDPSAPDGPIADAASVSGGGAPAVSASSHNQISPQPASFGIDQVDVTATGVDGQPDTQAGSHPYELNTTIAFATQLSATTESISADAPIFPAEEPDDIVTNLPPGLLGDPQAAPQCSLTDFGQGICPTDSQVGMVTIDDTSDGSPWTLPVYNITPQPGKTAELGFNDGSTGTGGQQFLLTAGVRTGGDYGLQVVSAGTPQALLNSVSLTIWGDPADPSHDAQRSQICIQGTPDPISPCTRGGVPSGAAPQPFLTLPTSCSAPLEFSVASNTYEDPGVYRSLSTSLPALTGCAGVDFAPTLTAAPDTSQASAPAGLSVDLSVPQSDAPLAFVYGNGTSSTATGLNYGGTATATLRDASVTLPAGMTINPSSGDGLVGCSDAQIALSSADAGSCPDASKIGTVVLHTPLLPNPLPGDVYVGTPLCNPCSPADAASGRMVRLFIQINDPVSGVIVKLPGTVSVNQSTGQLTATFDQNPQLPFSDLQLTFKGGPRAPLVNPSTCGSFTTTSDLAPWSAPFSGPDATPSSTFDITGCGNPNTFSPSFTAGTTNPQAGAYSPFVLSFQRTDAEQAFKGLTVSLPPGVTAKLAGVPLCSDSDANAGTCPASSQVGTVQTASGAGSEPLELPGTAYLTGPYKGAPYGLAVEVPAIAGPFNLGTVVVRQALNINPTTAQVTAVSDPFPSQLDGIPLRIQQVEVDLDRPDFTLNPTSCHPMTIGATLTSTGGMTANESSHFQVGGCQDIGFSPKLKIALSGKGKTRSGDHPTLTATLTDRSGQANLRSAKVTLPLSMALDPNNSQHVCSYATATAVHGGPAGCPTKTIVGTATAVTPLLSKPLTGRVYLVQGLRCAKGSISAQGTCPGGKTAIHTLPTLLVPLRGQIALDLRAKSSVNRASALVTTFPTIPDAPVSKFTLQITGGPKGLLVVTGRGLNICAKKQVASENLGAQSGKSMVADDTLTTPCKVAKKSSKKAA